MSRAELLLLWVSCTALTVHTRDAGRRWAAQPHLSTDGLCRYGNSMECCWGWTRTDQGGCKPHCQQECKHGVCVGPDRCQCHPGYTGKTCNQDLNECGLRPRPCKHRCMNTVGSYKCFCLDGYTLHQDGGCRDTRNCFYANCQYGCEVVKGDVRCTCPSPGLRLGPDRRTCVDIDECVQRRGVCPRDRKCVNTFGSFLCNCPHGLRLVYIKGRYTCTDKDTRPFCALNPFSPKCRRCRGRHCRDVPLVTLLPPPAPRTTKPAPPRTTATPRPPYRKTTASRTTLMRTTAGTATSTATSTASTLLRPNTTPTATVSVATTMTTAVTISPTPVTTATPQIFTTGTSESTTVPDPVSAVTTAATTTVHVFTTANATSIPSTTTITATSTTTHTPSTTAECTPTPSTAVSTTTAPPPTPSTAVSTTAAPPPTPSTAVSTTAAPPPTPSTAVSTTAAPPPTPSTAVSTTTTAPPTTSTVTTTTSTPRPSSTATSSSTTIATATGSSIPITTSGGAMTTTLDNRINKDLTQRPRGDVHIPRQDTQVWEFDIELGNTAEMRDDPASGLLHCSMDWGVCDWLSDREGDVDWNTVQSTSGGWYLSVAELKAGQRSVRGARLAVALAPPRNQEEMCFSFSHWLTGHHVGGLQLFVRKTGSRYSPALWSRTEGQGWKTTLVKLERDTERVLLRAERRRGQKGQIAVDDITLKSGPCR